MKYLIIICSILLFGCDIIPEKENQTTQRESVSNTFYSFEDTLSNGQIVKCYSISSDGLSCIKE